MANQWMTHDVNVNIKPRANRALALSLAQDSYGAYEANETQPDTEEGMRPPGLPVETHTQNILKRADAFYAWLEKA